MVRFKVVLSSIDIKMMVFDFYTVNEALSPIYDGANGNTFFNLKDGDRIPCGLDGTFTKDGDFFCFITKKDITD